MNKEELKKFIEENVVIGLSSSKNWTEDKLNIKVSLSWKGDPYKSFSKSEIALNLDRKDSVYY